MDAAEKAEVLRRELARLGEARGDGLPKSFAARMLYRRLQLQSSERPEARWKRIPLWCGGCLLRLAGVEKRYSAHFD